MGRRIHKLVKASGLSEDELLHEIGINSGLLNGISPNVKNIFTYAFTEMVNNAIDHSKTKYVDVTVSIKGETISFVVEDFGIGIFENVMQKKHLASELEAIQDILKGKTTTAPEKHSGEGIFFTSNSSDKFVIESHKKRLTVDNNLKDVFLEDRRFKKGTKIYFEINIKTKKNIMDIFKQFTNEAFSFDKSKIAVKLFQSGDSYVSRSQAKRLLHSMENFPEVILDFSKVETVGQAFADEVFRVFQNNHPEIKISAINANENVDFMLKRVNPDL